MDPFQGSPVAQGDGFTIHNQYKVPHLLPTKAVVMLRNLRPTVVSTALGAGPIPNSV